MTCSPRRSGSSSVGWRSSPAASSSRRRSTSPPFGGIAARARCSTWSLGSPISRCCADQSSERYQMLARSASTPRSGWPRRPRRPGPPGAPGLLHRVRRAERAAGRRAGSRTRPSKAGALDERWTSGRARQPPRGHRLRQGDRRRRSRPADRRPARPVRLPARTLQRGAAVDGPGGGGGPGRAAAAASAGAVRQRPAGPAECDYGRPCAGSTPPCCSTASLATPPGSSLPAGARQRRPRAGQVRPLAELHAEGLSWPRRVRGRGRRPARTATSGSSPG